MIELALQRDFSLKVINIILIWSLCQLQRLRRFNKAAAASCNLIILAAVFPAADNSRTSMAVEMEY